MTTPLSGQFFTNIIYMSALYIFTSLSKNHDDVYAYLDKNDDGFYEVPYTEEEWKKIWNKRKNKSDSTLE